MDLNITVCPGNTIRSFLNKKKLERLYAV